jgi:opine dehydrogenase
MLSNRGASSYHESMFLELLSFLKAGQTVVTLAANFASLVYLKLLTGANKAQGIDLIDMASLPYVCRADNAGTVEIVTTKKSIAVASIPAAAINKHIQTLSSFFPCELIPYPDVLSLGMNSTNGLAHPFNL